MSNLTSVQDLGLMRKITFEVIHDISQCPELEGVRVLVAGELARAHYVPGVAAKNVQLVIHHTSKDTGFPSDIGRMVKFALHYKFPGKYRAIGDMISMYHHSTHTGINFGRLDNYWWVDEPSWIRAADVQAPKNLPINRREDLILYHITTFNLHPDQDVCDEFSEVILSLIPIEGRLSFSDKQILVLKDSLKSLSRGSLLEEVWWKRKLGISTDGDAENVAERGDNGVEVDAKEDGDDATNANVELGRCGQE